MSFYSVGVGALNAAQLGLTTAGHNIANVSTEGYHRQATNQATNIALMTGSGFIGQGVHVDTVKRVYSQFLDNQVLQAQTQATHLDAYQTEISQLDNILADPDSGLSPALQDFFKAVGDVSTNPQSVPSRQALMSAASAMITRFQTLDRRFTEVRDGVNSQIAENVNLINSYAQQIAKINEQIVILTGNTNQPPNDLLDTRENLIAQLNQHVRATVVQQDDGAINVFIGSGQPLVIGQQTFSLAAVPSPDDQGRIEVGYRSGSATILLPKNSLTGGALGGLLDFRNTTLDSAQNALGRVALVLAETFNDQHRLGQDLAGTPGLDFFTLSPSATTVTANVNNTGSGVVAASLVNVSNLTTSDYTFSYDGTNYILRRDSDNTQWSGATLGALNTAFSATEGFQLTLASGAINAGDRYTVQPTRYGARNITLSNTISTTTIAAASPVVVNAATTNTGAAKVTNSGITATPVPALPITLTYNSTTGQFAYGAGPTLVAYTPGSPMTIAGNIQLTMTGTPANGDVFTIGANTGGISDNRNALLLAKLQTANLLEGGTTSYQGAYSQLVSQVGNKAAEVQVTAQAEENLLAQARSSQQALSGVNLDEEAANLMRFQQAYQAAGKMMQIANNMFDTLLSIAG